MDSWKQLKSRPIIGAEQDPMKTPSKALFSLLQELLCDFKRIFPSLKHSIQPSDFTVLAGCDDYNDRIKSLRLDSAYHSKTVIMTASSVHQQAFIIYRKVHEDLM